MLETNAKPESHHPSTLAISELTVPNWSQSDIVNRFEHLLVNNQTLPLQDFQNFLSIPDLHIFLTKVPAWPQYRYLRQ